MRIKVDEKNRRVIAMGNYKGKKVKAIAVCHPEDNFDVEVGIQIATLKYQLKEQEVKRGIHLSNLKVLKEHVAWANRVIEDEEKICNNMDKKISAMSISCKEKINNIVK